MLNDWNKCEKIQIKNPYIKFWLKQSKINLLSNPQSSILKSCDNPPKTFVVDSNDQIQTTKINLLTHSLQADL
jgi:hypothetical protein